MSKKLSGNGLWESSRMMLPEHKARIAGHRYEEDNRHTRPTLDQEEQGELARIIAEAMFEGREIVATIFGTYGHRRVVARPTRVDKIRRAVEFNSGGEKEWVAFDDILGATLR